MEHTSPTESAQTEPANHHKQKRAIVMLVVLFGLVVLGMFVFTFMKQSELRAEPATTVEVPAAEDTYAGINRIDGKHFFVDDTHTIVGEIVLPTPCDLLDTAAIVQETYPEQITLDFRVINNADACAQVMTSQRFRVDVVASEDAVFSALFENRVVELNLTPAGPNETPDDFELFMKG